MKILKNTAGFSVIEVVIAVAVVGILGLVGFNVYDRQQDKTADSNTQTTQNPIASNDDIPSAPIINSTEDLTKAEKALDDTNTGSSTDSAQLDAELAAF